MRKIVLVGYMGSGKSVIGKLLATKVGYKFVDSDMLIEKKLKCAISLIFEKFGELYFRKIENEIFIELLANEDNLVIATGGGLPCYYDNHLLFKKENVVSLYLKASIRTLVNRLVLELDKRPLLITKEGSELEEFVAKHVFERSFFYLKSKFVVVVEDKSLDQIVLEIKEKLT